MAAVTGQEVDAMKALLMKMNEDSILEDSPVAATAKHTAAPSMESVPGKDAMKSILESFYSASDEAVTRVEEILPHSRELREAIQTTKTPNGVTIGSWEVTKYQYEGDDTPLYDITNPATGDTKFEGLVIFEAAHAIVRYLNKGLAETHAKIEEILDIEESFRRNRQDAATFKRRYNTCKNKEEFAAAEVFSARFQKAKAQAVASKDQLQSILDNIR